LQGKMSMTRNFFGSESEAIRDKIQSSLAEELVYFV